jgi:hypothetical protein
MSATFVRPRDPARYIAVKDRGQTLYFEISRSGTLIAPREFTDEGAPAAAEPPLAACLERPGKRAHAGFEFVGFLDPARLQRRAVGYSIADLLARPSVPMRLPLLLV